MDSFINFLIFYLGFVALLTPHEWAHAWVALKCGDDTAKREGRVSMNPLVHIDPIGTVMMPLLGFFLSGTALGSFVIGWAKPVPVSIANLRQPRLDDSLIAMAGPMMNLFLAALLIGLIKVGEVMGVEVLEKAGYQLAIQSLFLCFFNLVPIPPLDGSHVLQHLVGMSYDTYWKICQFGFIILIAVWNFIPAVPAFVVLMSKGSFHVLAQMAGV